MDGGKIHLFDDALALQRNEFILYYVYEILYNMQEKIYNRA